MELELGLWWVSDAPSATIGGNTLVGALRAAARRTYTVQRLHHPSNERGVPGGAASPPCAPPVLAAVVGSRPVMLGL